MTKFTSNWIDHLLSCIASILAVYSASMGIRNTYAATLFPLLVVGGYTFAFVLSLFLRKTRWAGIDGWLYVGVAAYVIIRQAHLNALLPSDGFELKLRYAGILCWMISLGSYCTFRDQSLLFQSVPSIALFGLVGAWNTFEGSKILFFAFLLCVATLFARSHFRAMRYRALAAGISNERELSSGAWKWMAGPEWALGTACAVVVLSLLGAPLLQNSVSGVSGAIRISTPVRNLASITSSSNTYGSQPGTFNIGQGPRGISELPVMRARLDEQRYLRSATFDVYTGRGWLSANHNRILPTNRGGRSTPPGSKARPYDPTKFIRNSQVIPFEIEILFGEHPRLYLPGEPWELPRNGFAPIMLRDGSVAMDSPFRPGQRYSGSAICAPNDASPKTTAKPFNLPEGFANEFLVTDNIPDRVQALALSVTKNAKNDYQRALLIKREIESRCKYNLEAPAVPRDADPMESFLFESNEGYCDLFASAMCGMARAAGLPARIGLGFYPNDPVRDGDGFFVIREADYHVWAEIFFDDVGWVVFDPTEGAENVGESRRGAVLKKSDPFYTLAWFRNALDASIGALTIVGLFLLIRMWSLSVNPRDPKTALDLQYLKFEQTIEQYFDRRRRLHQTTLEFIRGINFGNPKVELAANDLADKFDAALFSSTPPTGPDIEQFKASNAAFAKLLREAKPRYAVKSHAMESR